MFTLSPNKKLWQKLANDPECSPYLRRAIEVTLMKYNIDVIKWSTNVECFNNWSLYDSNHQFAVGRMYDIITSFTSLDLPLERPDWFIAGFPDVYYWMLKNNKLVVSEFETYPENKYLDSKGRTTPEGWNILVELYKKKTGCVPQLSLFF